MEKKIKNFVLNDKKYKGKILVCGKILVQALLENMQLGLYMTMDLDVLFLVFLQIYLKIIV